MLDECCRNILIDEFIVSVEGQMEIVRNPVYSLSKNLFIFVRLEDGQS